VPTTKRTRATKRAAAIDPWSWVTDQFRRYPFVAVTESTPAFVDLWHERRKAAQRAADAEFTRAFRAQQRARSKKGVQAKRDNRARNLKELRVRVRILRAKYPRASARALGCLLLPVDQRSDRRAIERQARVRRLERSKK
jgi:hypothetical protein